MCVCVCITTMTTSDMGELCSPCRGGRTPSNVEIQRFDDYGNSFFFPYRFDRNKYKIIRSAHNPLLIAHIRRVLVGWSVHLTFVPHCCCRSNFCVKCLTHIIDRNYKNIIFPALLHNTLTTTWRPYSATNQWFNSKTLDVSLKRRERGVIFPEISFTPFQFCQTSV